MRDLIQRLDRVLNPRTAAVVGDKGPGYMWLKNMSTFTGKLYSVQIDPAQIPGIEALGVPNYSSLMEIPDEIDLVLCAVPRNVAPRVVADAIAKKVGGMQMFTSGFAETGEALGLELQQKILQAATENDLLIVGPNCMGIYNPRSGVRFSTEQPAGEGGSVGFISQSGTHGMNFSLLAASNGIKLSKAISIGNAIVLDAADCLEYFVADPQTEIIAMYVEGVRDGRRFFEVLREATKRKPVIVWKGGRTAAGQRATRSHTASLASSQRVWNAMIKQTGAVPALNLDETVDLVQVFLRSKPPAGTGVALLAMTGGQSVVMSDAFADAGLDVPLLSERSYEELASFFNIIGGSYRNPFDMGGTIGGDQENLSRMLRILDEDDAVDAMVMEVSPSFMGRRWANDPEALQAFLNRLTAHRDRSAKPLLTVMPPGHAEKLVADQHPRLQEVGLPVLPSFERAARALRQAAAYHRYRSEID
jgi:acyl-CoA synthetase (NDP forming)